MATATHIPLAEYLKTTYRPDREFIDGEIRERHLGKKPHARLHSLLNAWFVNHEALWDIVTYTEQRMQVSPTRVRIPDLTIVRPGPQPDVFTDPPLLVIEILSPDDTYSGLEERSRDYLAMGVENVWIIDPKNRTARMCLEDTWTAADRLEVYGSAIFVSLAELFAQVEPFSQA